jgi:hypothetical protein
MTKKIPVGMLAFLIGVLAVLIVIEVASAGYKFGQYLAHVKAQESRLISSPSS